MDIGTGIAIAGAWICVGMLGLSRTVTAMGFWLGIACAFVVTFSLK